MGSTAIGEGNGCDAVANEGHCHGRGVATPGYKQWDPYTGSYYGLLMPVCNTLYTCILYAVYTKHIRRIHEPGQTII